MSQLIVTQAVFIIYLIGVFIGLLACMISLFLNAHGDSRKADSYKAMRNYIICSFILSVLYFFFYYRESILVSYEESSIIRAADYFVTVLYVYVWIRFMHSLIGKEHLKKLVFTSRLIFAVISLIEVFGAVFLIDEYYIIENTQTRAIFSICEIVLILIEFVIIAVYVIECMKKLTESAMKRFIMMISILITIYIIKETWSTITFYSENYDADLLPSFGGVLLMIITSLTLILIYRMDFNPLFFANRGNNDDLTGIVDNIAEKHLLTQREREALLLLYNGYTNPEIAEKMDIAMNTAKGHVHHIFKKLNVDSRVELVHMINSQK